MKEEIIKQQIKERYGKIVFVGNSSECCCAPTECYAGSSDSNNGSQAIISPMQIAENIGYNANDLNSFLNLPFLV
jgi:hypothetical protein